MFKSVIPFVFDFRLFVLLTFGFIAFTVIGTISHESGHYAMARLFGFQAHINYNATYYHASHKELLFHRVTGIRYHNQIEANQPFPEKDRYDRLINKYNKAGIWITWGGPLQTMLTGTIGLIMMIFLRRRYFSSERLSFWLWFMIFITLFWLRQTTNFVMAIITRIIRGPTIKGFGDESGLARYSHLPIWSISAITGFIGLAILTLVVIKFIPIKQRLTFVSAGLVGGVSGFVFWLVLFGKMIMP
jgi:hypothetical protein